MGIQQQHSPFDCVNSRLQTGENDIDREDLETIVRRCDRVRGFGGEFGDVGLSPYIRSLLGVAREPLYREEPVEARLAISV